jgi:MoaA/NifB/PqqE/SkfB family radical SAM enzyme
MSQLMLNIQQQIDSLHTQYKVLAVVDLDYWSNETYQQSQQKLIDICAELYQAEYQIKQRIFFSYTRDYYVKDQPPGILLKNIQVALNEQDISNFFVVIISTNPKLADELTKIAQMSSDLVAVTGIVCDGNFDKHVLSYHPHSNKELYQYGSANPVKIGLNELSDREKFLLTESKTFCNYPWIHLHAYPTGEAYPCCHAEMGVGQIGNCRTHTLEQIWNGQSQTKLRTDMLSETANPACGRCYEQEKSGFFSGRKSANKHHGHHVDRASYTNEDGTVDQFEMTYWDIRFSNLCNLKCRSCGHIFSSQWYQDQAKLAGGDWKDRNTVLNYAGRTETDMWEQLAPHLDYVEQIYFAGGEPLLMEEHYRILEELERRGRFDVRLIYNTNFTQTRLKDRTVFDYWRKFDRVAVGASLDASGPRGEYIRKGTDWAVVESNRRQMMEICPRVDFYISPTLSIMNAMHLPDFHRDWVEKGLIKPQDLNVNILQDPAYLRIDIASTEYKQQIQHKFEQHLEWLRPLDQLNRATVGFESAITFMNSTDNTHLLDTFWRKTHELDSIRREHVLDVLPELRAIK